MGALVALARQVLSTLGFRGGIVQTARRVGIPVGLGAVGAEIGIPGFGGGDGVPRRRRRRKMFTDTDLAQFAAAEGIAGKKAAATLMMIRAAKA